MRISAAKGPAGSGAVGGEERIVSRSAGMENTWGGLGGAFGERKKVWALACEGRGGLGIA